MKLTIKNCFRSLLMKYIYFSVKITPQKQQIAFHSLFRESKSFQGSMPPDPPWRFLTPSDHFKISVPLNFGQLNLSPVN